jgi:hypothetical protein
MAHPPIDSYRVPKAFQTDNEFFAANFDLQAYTSTKTPSVMFWGKAFVAATRIVKARVRLGTRADENKLTHAWLLTQHKNIRIVALEI